MKARTPDYGVDAPGVIKAFFAVAALLAIAGTIIAGAGAGRSWAVAIGLTALGIAIIPLAFGATMVAYVTVGKYRVRDLMLDWLALQGNEAVLDVGTGRGLLAVGAAKRLTTGRAVGIDVWSAKDLTGNGPQGARENAGIEGVGERVMIADGDARALAFADDSFDAVVSLLCLHNIEGDGGRDRACAEIARVLKPGGRVVIGDYVPTHAYAAAFERAGLSVRSSTTHVALALGPMWIVVAGKPLA